MPNNERPTKKQKKSLTKLKTKLNELMKERKKQKTPLNFYKLSKAAIETRQYVLNANDMSRWPGDRPGLI